MLRVLLVIDDYNELLYLQTVLKKVGFDVEGLQSQKKFSDASLGFNPQIVILTARGHQIDGMQIARNVRKVRGFPKLLALKSVNVTLAPDELNAAGFDLVLDTPVNMKRLVLGVAGLGEIDEKPFLEKLEKIQGSPSGGADHGAILLSDAKQPTSVPTEGTSVETPSVLVDEEQKAARRDRYEEFVQKNKLPNKNSFDRNRILDFNKKIRSAPQPEDMDEIEDERKQFVKSLFTKGKSQS